MKQRDSSIDSSLSSSAAVETAVWVEVDKVAASNEALIIVIGVSTFTACERLLTVGVELRFAVDYRSKIQNEHCNLRSNETLASGQIDECAGHNRNKNDTFVHCLTAVPG